MSKDIYESPLSSRYASPYMPVSYTHLPVEQLQILHLGQVTAEGLVQMVMGVDEAGIDDATGGVDDLLRLLFLRADVGDNAVFHQQMAVGINRVAGVTGDDVGLSLIHICYYDQLLGSSRCIVAPAGTPENVIKFYEDAFQKLMEDADYLKAAEALSLIHISVTSAAESSVRL